MLASLPCQSDWTGTRGCVISESKQTKTSERALASSTSPHKHQGQRQQQQTNAERGQPRERKRKKKKRATTLQATCCVRSSAPKRGMCASEWSTKRAKRVRRRVRSELVRRELQEREGGREGELQESFKRELQESFKRAVRELQESCK